MSGFASTKDLADKTVSFDELAPGLYGYTAEGDPNSGVVVEMWRALESNQPVKSAEVHG